MNEYVQVIGWISILILFLGYLGLEYWNERSRRKFREELLKSKVKTMLEEIKLMAENQNKFKTPMQKVDALNQGFVLTERYLKNVLAHQKNDPGFLTYESVHQVLIQVTLLACMDVFAHDPEAAMEELETYLDLMKFENRTN